MPVYKQFDYSIGPKNFYGQKGHYAIETLE